MKKRPPQNAKGEACTVKKYPDLGCAIISFEIEEIRDAILEEGVEVTIDQIQVKLQSQKDIETDIFVAVKATDIFAKFDVQTDKVRPLSVRELAKWFDEKALEVGAAPWNGYDDDEVQEENEEQNEEQEEPEQSEEHAEQASKSGHHSSGYGKWIIHLDEIPMPKRPSVEPTSSDREVFMDPLPGEEDEGLDDLLGVYGEAEEIYYAPSNADPRMRADKGYVLFKTHEAAKKCVEDQLAVWSESERAHGPGSVKRNRLPSAYPKSLVAFFCNNSGEKLKTIQKTSGVQKLFVGGLGDRPGKKDRALFCDSKRVHFECEATLEGFKRVLTKLEDHLADFHEHIFSPDPPNEPKESAKDGGKQDGSSKRKQTKQSQQRDSNQGPPQQQRAGMPSQNRAGTPSQQRTDQPGPPPWAPAPPPGYNPYSNPSLPAPPPPGFFSGIPVPPPLGVPPPRGMVVPPPRPPHLEPEVVPPPQRLLKMSTPKGLFTLEELKSQAMQGQGYWSQGQYVPPPREPSAPKNVPPPVAQPGQSGPSRQPGPSVAQPGQSGPSRQPGVHDVPHLNPSKNGQRRPTGPSQAHVAQQPQMVPPPPRPSKAPKAEKQWKPSDHSMKPPDHSMKDSTRSTDSKLIGVIGATQLVSKRSADNTVQVGTQKRKSDEDRTYGIATPTPAPTSAPLPKKKKSDDGPGGRQEWTSNNGKDWNSHEGYDKSWNSKDKDWSDKDPGTASNDAAGRAAKRSVDSGEPPQKIAKIIRPSSSQGKPSSAPRTPPELLRSAPSAKQESLKSQRALWQTEKANLKKSKSALAESQTKSDQTDSWGSNAGSNDVAKSGGTTVKKSAWSNGNYATDSSNNYATDSGSNYATDSSSSWSNWHDADDASKSTSPSKWHESHGSDEQNAGDLDEAVVALKAAVLDFIGDWVSNIDDFESDSMIWPSLSQLCGNAEVGEALKSVKKSSHFTHLREWLETNLADDIQISRGEGDKWQTLYIKPADS